MIIMFYNQSDLFIEEIHGQHALHGISLHVAASSAYPEVTDGVVGKPHGAPKVRIV